MLKCTCNFDAQIIFLMLVFQNNAFRVTNPGNQCRSMFLQKNTHTHTHTYIYYSVRIVPLYRGMTQCSNCTIVPDKNHNNPHIHTHNTYICYNVTIGPLNHLRTQCSHCTIVLLYYCIGYHTYTQIQTYIHYSVRIGQLNHLLELYHCTR